MTGSALPGPALLFCPADRPDRYAKALAAADGVIIDLEDGVGAANKDAARTALAASDLDPARIIVRVNATSTEQYATDMAMLRLTRYRTIMLPKAETRAQFDSLDSDWQVAALCETAAGVLAAPQIAAVPNVVAMLWGAEDLIASMHGRTSRNANGRYRDVARHARSAVLLAAAANGRAAIDSVWVNIPDLDGLAAEAEDAASSGFTHKACIHPTQVAVVRQAFQASEKQIAWARRVLAAARDAAVGDKGAVKVEGQMIDAPPIRQAEAIIASVS